MRWSILFFGFIILASASLTNKIFFGKKAIPKNDGLFTILDKRSPLTAELEGKTFLGIQSRPRRRWDVLDPEITAEAVLIESLDDNFPFYRLNTGRQWSIAALTKFMTAAVVLEDIGRDKKIEITEKGAGARGSEGDLKSGEVYRAEDLLKIMLLVSSNDAARVFEDYAGGEDEFTRLMNKKARQIGMSSSFFYDAAGSSDLNQSTAEDFSQLMKYILLKHPEIFNWTRMPSFFVQAINGLESRTVQNTNPSAQLRTSKLTENESFLGGKIGSSRSARENLAGIFSFDKKRLMVIILGSKDRTKEQKALFDWVRKAYTWGGNRE